jgi:hypothetical protein
VVYWWTRHDEDAATECGRPYLSVGRSVYLSPQCSRTDLQIPSDEEAMSDPGIVLNGINALTWEFLGKLSTCLPGPTPNTILRPKRSTLGCTRDKRFRDCRVTGQRLSGLSQSRAQTGW